MKIEVVASPKLLVREHLEGRTVVVFDVLRATTTMLSALAAGAIEIRLFGDVDDCRLAGLAFAGPRILCGERRALPPPGFDLGNSPGDFTAERCRGRTLFMTTTNGTAAVLAAREAAEVLIGAVANRSAVAQRLRITGRDATLLCAGQRGDLALEDLIGCGAVLDRLPAESVELANDASAASLHLYRQFSGDLANVFRTCRGARTELLQGLSADIDFCAVVDRYVVIGRLDASSNAIKLAD